MITDHDQIRQWAEKHNGQPQRIDDPEARADSIGIRINFPGADDDIFLPSHETKNISWQEFFDRFEQLQLGMELMEGTSYRFIKRQIATSKNEKIIEKTYDKIQNDLDEAAKIEE